MKKVMLLAILGLLLFTVPVAMADTVDSFWIDFLGANWSPYGGTNVTTSNTDGSFIDGTQASASLSWGDPSANRSSLAFNQEASLLENQHSNDTLINIGTIEYFNANEFGIGSSEINGATLLLQFSATLDDAAATAHNFSIALNFTRTDTSEGSAMLLMDSFSVSGAGNAGDYKFEIGMIPESIDQVYDNQSAQITPDFKLKVMAADDGDLGDGGDSGGGGGETPVPEATSILLLSSGLGLLALGAWRRRK